MSEPNRLTVDNRDGIGALQVPFLIAKDAEGNLLLNQENIGWAVTLNYEGIITSGNGKLLGRLEFVCGDLALVAVKGIISLKFASSCAMDGLIRVSDIPNLMDELECGPYGNVKVIIHGRGVVIKVDVKDKTCEVLL